MRYQDLPLREKGAFSCAHQKNIIAPIIPLPQLKHEYQEQTAELEIKAEDGSIFVHECVISVYSNFMRFLVKKAKESNPEKITLDFSNYSKEILKIYFDLLYGVNHLELGVNDILQLIELVLGEGHFGNDYPWHTKTLGKLTERLRVESQNYDPSEKIILSLALSKFPIPPVTVLIESLTENIGLSQVDTSIAQVMRETNWGKSLVDIGKGYIPNSCSPLAMISRYLLLSSIPLNRHTIWDELEKMFTCLELQKGFVIPDPVKDEESAEFTEEYDEDDDPDFPDPEESSQEESSNFRDFLNFATI